MIKDSLRTQQPVNKIKLKNKGMSNYVLLIKELVLLNKQRTGEILLRGSHKKERKKRGKEREKEGKGRKGGGEGWNEKRKNKLN